VSAQNKTFHQAKKHYPSFGLNLENEVVLVCGYIINNHTVQIKHRKSWL